jgi:hypothetical protein
MQVGTAVMQTASEVATTVVDRSSVLVILHRYKVTNWWGTPLVHATVGYISARRLTRMYFIHCTSHLTRR